MASVLDIKSISKLGTTEVGFAELSGVEKVLTDFVKKVTKSATDNLDKDGINASMALRQSIVAIPVRQMGKDYIVEIEMDSYWKYVNEGVQGAVDQSKAIGSPFKYKEKGPPIQNLADYIRDKPIKVTPREDLKTGKMRSTMEQAMVDARGMSKAIKDYGTKRTLFFDKALPESLQKSLVEDVAEALGVNISISMKL